MPALIGVPRGHLTKVQFKEHPLCCADDLSRYHVMREAGMSQSSSESNCTIMESLELSDSDHLGDWNPNLWWPPEWDD